MYISLVKIRDSIHFCMTMHIYLFSVNSDIIFTRINKMP